MDFNQALTIAKEYGQEHLFRYYEELSEEQKKNLLAQFDLIDFSLLKELEKESSEELEGVIEPLPGAMKIGQIEAEKEELSEIGLKALRGYEVGCVLLAGGQGTRLGSDNPKGMYDIGLTRPLYIFEMQIQNLMQVVKETGVWVPLFIMTSAKNDKVTRAFFEEHGYFGYNKEYVFFFVQAMAPSVDYNGKIYMEGKDTISMSPNGNGGWFISLVNSDAWDHAKRLGVKWLNVYAVDNVLQKMADPLFVGATIRSGCPVGAKAVAKAAPDERVGVLCRRNGKPSIVEYYELTENMMYAKNEEGEPLYNYGVILNYLLKVEELEKIVNNAMPVHIVEKKIPYMDVDGTCVKPEKPNGYKFETLILDMIYLMDDCLTFEVVREKEFAPIKNSTGVDSVESARILLQKNGVVL